MFKITNCIEECKAINKRAVSQERFHFQETIEECQDIPKRRAGVKYPSWFSLAMQARKSRSITDESSDVIAKFLRDQAINSKESSVKVPDYSQVYSHLASLVQGYAVKGLKGLVPY